MSSPVKFAGALPSGDANGLGAIVSDLTNAPEDRRVLIMVVDVKELKTLIDTGEVMPVLRVRRVEACIEADLPAARRLYRRALEHRTGRVALPIDVEEELDDAFGPDVVTPRS